MTRTTTSSAQQAGKAVLANAKHKAATPWVQWLERFGFLTRGLIYVVIGVLALQLAVGAGGATATPTQRDRADWTPTVREAACWP